MQIVLDQIVVKNLFWQQLKKKLVQMFVKH